MNNLMNDLNALTGATVEVYRNLHRNCLSVRLNGLVVAHVNEITLDGVVFKVSEAGRQRVIRERRKNVHALIKGRVVALQAAQDGVPVRYNPYLRPTFFRADNDEAVLSAERVSVGNNGIRIL